MAEKKPTKKNGSPSGGGGGAGGSAGSGNGGPMDVGLLEQLVKLMAANDLNTVDLRDGEKRVVLKRGQAVAAPGAYLPYPAMTQAAPAPAAPSGGAGTPAAAPPSAGGEEAGLTPIKSEMVGTFYSKPSPDAKPFVGVGSDVDEDTVVCVIEAMKHFNPVKADVRGTIAKVLVTDGQTVDVGKPLFLVRPA
jgi:acetyl-CoA carboxylase biotin carboxyl carrier protein